MQKSKFDPVWERERKESLYEELCIINPDLYNLAAEAQFLSIESLNKMLQEYVDYTKEIRTKISKLVLYRKDYNKFLKDLAKSMEKFNNDLTSRLEKAYQRELQEKQEQ